MMWPYNGFAIEKKWTLCMDSDQYTWFVFSFRDCWESIYVKQNRLLFRSQLIDCLDIQID